MSTSGDVLPAARLSDAHRRMLVNESGISEEIIAARGYRTISDAVELRELGFAPQQCRPPGLLLPLWTTDGRNGQYVFRPDNPRVVEDRKAGKLPDGTFRQRTIKYEQPQGEAVRVDCPPTCQPALGDPAAALFITEGQKKADALASRGACTIALTGVWNFKGKNALGGTTFLTDFDYIALDGRAVYLVFDSDVMTKAPVRQALERFTEHLQRKGAAVHAIYLPHLEGGKTGVDDWFVATGKGLPELVALAEGPRPEPKVAPALVELLDTAPVRMTRPLALVDGIAYAAVWPYVRVTRRETRDRKSGAIIRHDPPLVEEERRLFIVDSAGVVYGEGGDRGHEDLPLAIRLDETPEHGKLLTTAGLKKYRDTYRPQPAAVFRRIVEVVDHFIDFDRSLAPQQTMAEMIAAYIMATYMLDGLSVASNLWPNGDRGSGKTQLLAVICELAYLGQLVLAGGSFAALRDLADYGATLGFDDAENLADPRKTDPDKRTLLLAGNRRGNTVPVKEPTPDGRWRTRYVNTFSFRLFSAIRLPDNVLASRTIIVPLIRTADRDRANADPMVVSEWRHDRTRLVDDLWMLALEHLPHIPGHEREVNRRASLAGRNLEPWRPILTVALWLEAVAGADGPMAALFDRMNALSVAYQTERAGLEIADMTGLVIRALGRAIARAAGIADMADVSDVTRTKGHHPFATSQITDLAHTLAESDEVDVNPDAVTSRRVGRVLASMRFDKARQGKAGQRGWLISFDEWQRWAETYSIPVALGLGLTEPPREEPSQASEPATFQGGNVSHVSNASGAGSEIPQAPSNGRGHQASLLEGEL